MSVSSSSLCNLRGILFATDFCELSRRALLYVKKLALQTGAAVRSIHVIDLTQTAEADQRSFSFTHDSAERMLREIRRELRLAGVHETATLISAGDPAEAIRETAAQCGFGVIVLGVNSLGRPKQERLGNTARVLLQTAPCLVLTVGARCPEVPAPGPFRQTMIVGDDRPASLRAARQAWRQIGEFCTAPQYAVMGPGERELVNGFAHLFRPIRLVDYEHASETILAEAAQTDLMAVARQAHGHLDSFAPEGLSYKLATGAPCPVVWMREER